MEVMGQNKILGEGWTLLDERGARMEEEGKRLTGEKEAGRWVHQAPMAVTAKTIADIHESFDRNSHGSALYLIREFSPKALAQHGPRYITFPK